MPEFGRGGRGGGYGIGGGMRGGRGGRYNSGGNEDHLDPEHEQYRKLFVGGLSYETTTEGLKGHFEKHGEIVDCVVMKDPHTKRSRGFGFVTFKEAAMLDDAQENRPHKIDGRETETKRAMPREESGRSESQQSVTKLFIGGCKDDTTEDHLRDTFGSYGEIEKIDLITDRTTGKTKGFSFVTFKDYDSVDKCVLKKVHNLNGRNVEVKKAENKEEKAARAARGGGMMGMGQGWGGDQGFGGQAYGRGQGGFGGGGYGVEEDMVVAMVTKVDLVGEGVVAITTAGEQEVMTVVMEVDIIKVVEVEEEEIGAELQEAETLVPVMETITEVGPSGEAEITVNGEKGARMVLDMVVLEEEVTMVTVTMVVEEVVTMVAVVVTMEEVVTMVTVTMEEEVVTMEVIIDVKMLMNCTTFYR